ncbi:MAG: hypothetical protein LBD15_03445 [Holosporales bacterium]|nr:hypothetical protein [Holosporales bacterium]
MLHPPAQQVKEKRHLLVTIAFPKVHQAKTAPFHLFAENAIEFPSSIYVTLQFLCPHQTPAQNYHQAGFS